MAIGYFTTLRIRLKLCLTSVLQQSPLPRRVSSSFSSSLPNLPISIVSILLVISIFSILSSQRSLALYAPPGFPPSCHSLPSTVGVACIVAKVESGTFNLVFSFKPGSEIIYAVGRFYQDLPQYFQCRTGEVVPGGK